MARRGRASPSCRCLRLRSRSARPPSHSGSGCSAIPASRAEMPMYGDPRPPLLANARIVDPSRELDMHGDLLIADGVIRDAQQGIRASGVPQGTDIVDCGGKLVAPGLIDMRAFIGEPGAEYRETLATASQAAA